MDLLEKIPDPILAFVIGTWYESHCFDKIGPQTERFQTLSESVGGIVLRVKVSSSDTNAGSI